jgi:hypothetical protein
MSLTSRGHKMGRVTAASAMSVWAAEPQSCWVAKSESGHIGQASAWATAVSVSHRSGRPCHCPTCQGCHWEGGRGRREDEDETRCVIDRWVPRKIKGMKYSQSAGSPPLTLQSVFSIPHMRFIGKGDT